MMDLENRIRASLQQRADDVEPTPELWQAVERKVARKRALPVFVWVAAGAAAAITAVAVLPGVLDSTETFTIDPANPPTAVEPTPGEEQTVGTQQPSHLVAISGSRLVLRASDGSSETVLAEFPAAGESTLETLAVRPGSSPDDLTVAFVTSAEGMYDLRLLRMGPDGAVSTSVVAGNLSPTMSSLDAVAPTVAWSPDGRTMAWAAPNADGRPSLFLMDLQAHLDAVADGSAPGTPVEVPLLAAESDDGAAIRLDACAVSAGTCGQLRLQDWRQGPEAGELAFTSEGLLMRASIRRVEDGWAVAQGDGETGVASDTSRGGYVVDVAAGDERQEWVLTAGGATTQDAEDANLQLHLGDQSVGIDLATAAPSGVWLTAVPGGAIVGLGGDARMVSVADDGLTVGPLASTSYAAFVPVSGEPATPTGSTGGGTASGPLSAAGVTPYLTIDEAGRILFIDGDGGGDLAVLYDPESEADAVPTPVDLAVQPGSTVDELTAVVLMAYEGGPELRVLHAGADGVSFEPFPPGLGIGPSADYGALQVPVWSPDGRHLAWAERDGSGAWTLRTIGWDGGPGTGDPADDNASFGLDLAVEDLVVADWVWDGTDGAPEGAILMVADRDAADASQPTSFNLPIQRQGDGALALSGELSPIDEPGLHVVDLDVTDGQLTRLVREADGSYAVLLVSPSDEPIVVPFGGAQPRDVDLDALEGVVIVTDRTTGEAFVVDRDGEVAPLQADAATTHGFDRVD